VNLLLERCVRSVFTLFGDTARRDGNREGDDQKSRQVMRPDINWIEMKRERQHHHRVLGAGRKGDHDIGDREGK
jgi:hypothetical protein